MDAVYFEQSTRKSPLPCWTGAVGGANACGSVVVSYTVCGSIRTIVHSLSPKVKFLTAGDLTLWELA